MHTANSAVAILKYICAIIRHDLLISFNSIIGFMHFSHAQAFYSFIRSTEWFIKIQNFSLMYDSYVVCANYTSSLISAYRTINMAHPNATINWYCSWVSNVCCTYSTYIYKCWKRLKRSRNELVDSEQNSKSWLKKIITLIYADTYIRCSTLQHQKWTERIHACFVCLFLLARCSFFFKSMCFVCIRIKSAITVATPHSNTMKAQLFLSASIVCVCAFVCPHH